MLKNVLPARALLLILGVGGGLWAGALARGPDSAQALGWALLTAAVVVALLQQTLA